MDWDTFRLPELESIADMMHITFQCDDVMSQHHAFVHVELANENDAIQLASRLTLLKAIYEVWGHGDTIEECVSSVDTRMATSYTGPGTTFCFHFDAFGRRFTKEGQTDIMAQVSTIPLPEEIKLSNPGIIIGLLLDYGIEATLLKCKNGKTPIPPLKHMYIGRQLATGQNKVPFKYTLKQRQYIGNTSTDASLAFLYANQAQAKSGDLIWDPCCGTGSILVACAALGAHVVGSDLSYFAIRGKTPEEKFRHNFHQYGIPHQLVDIWNMDLSQSSIRDGVIFDAIVTDPPYGIREGTKRLVRNPIPYDKSYKGMHAPQKEPYSLYDILSDLFELARRHLKRGGRLVFLLPVGAKNHSRDLLPPHPHLQVIAESHQVLSAGMSRHLITMVSTS